MTDQELQQLAREYANKHLTSGCFNMNGEPRVDVRDLAYFYETLLSDIAKTHCIVSREKVTNIYNSWHNALVDQPQSQSHKSVVATLHTIFGKSTFDNPKPAEQ